MNKKISVDPNCELLHEALSSLTLSYLYAMHVKDINLKVVSATFLLVFYSSL